MWLCEWIHWMPLPDSSTTVPFAHVLVQLSCDATENYSVGVNEAWSMEHGAGVNVFFIGWRLRLVTDWIPSVDHLPMHQHISSRKHAAIPHSS
jgi:hypothetical protein